MTFGMESCAYLRSSNLVRRKMLTSTFMTGLLSLVALANSGVAAESGYWTQGAPEDISSRTEELVGGGCRARECDFQGDCCGGTVCVQLPNHFGAARGRCVPTTSRGEGAACASSDQCAEPLVCVRDPGGNSIEFPGTCERLLDERVRVRKSVYSKKKFSDECKTSADCDEELRMCCQLQKRHRQAPRRVCLYYENPLACIGDTATNALPRGTPDTWWTYLGKWTHQPYKFLTNYRYYY